MWTKDGVNLYLGDCQAGDRPATPQEVAFWDCIKSKSLRLSEISARLIEIDQIGARPSREASSCLLAGKQVEEFTINKLASLEKEAADLRSERAQLRV